MRAAEAAHAALAFEQAEVHLNQGLDLLATMPRDRERDRQELELQLRLGFLISRTRGRAWPEVARAFARAQELCASTGVTADQLRTLWGQFFVAYLTGKVEDAAGVGARLLDLGRRAEDSRCQMAGLIAEGTSEFFLGRLAEARGHLAQAASIADSLDDPAIASLYQQDARVASRNLLVLAVWLVGDYEEAEAIAAEQIRLATIVDHRPTQLAVPLSHGWLRLLQRDPEQVAEVVTRTLSLAAEIGHRPIALAAAMHQGWAMAQLGSTQAGAAQLRRTLEDLDAVRMVAARPCFLGLLAEAELLDGRPEAALATVDAALAEVARRGDRFYLPELFRLKGEMLRASGSEREATARTCFQQALQAAEAQGAVPFRDRAAKSLAEGRRTA
jgi:predicted ATPase